MNITVLGGGSFGKELFSVLLNNGHNVKMWSSFNEDSCDKGKALEDADVVVYVRSSKLIRKTMEEFKDFIKEDAIIVNASKGLEEGTLLRLSEVMQDVLSKNTIAVLSGPSHAEELSQGIPTTLVAASHDLEAAKIIQNLFMNEKLRVYTNTDVVGVELGGALKNVIALATGISDGIGYGDNTKSALMTRGLNEISKLGIALGAKGETFSGLSGIGDLIATCTSVHSRNRRCGILLGQGKSIELAVKEIGMVVEGVNTAKAAYYMSLKYNVNMPIISQIYNVLENGKNPKQAVYELMTRDRREEI